MFSIVFNWISIDLNIYRCHMYQPKVVVVYSLTKKLQGLINTVHYGPSNEIKEIEVCKKCPKVKPYCMPIFDPIMVKPFLDDAKWPKFCTKYVSLSKQSNIGCIFWICLWQIMNGWSDKLEIWHAENLDPVLKKARKQQFYPGSRSLWILHLKYTNIFPIFFMTWIKAKLFGFIF